MNSQGKNFQESNSILIRLEQIQKGGKVTITRDNISIFFEFSDNNSSFAQTNTTYERLITYDELVSLKSAIDLLESNDVYILKLSKEYLLCFDAAHKIQDEIQKLHHFGKSFVYKDHMFFDLINTNQNIIYNLSKLNENYISNYPFKQNDTLIKYPPYLTIDNLLFFGNLLQRKQKEKVFEILKLMFPHKEKIIDEAIKNVQNDDAINDPVKAAHIMFTNLYEMLKPIINFEKIAKYNVLDQDNIFYTLTNELTLYFSRNNFIVIKVSKPVETLHVLPIISSLLNNNDLCRIPYFFENFFCFEDSDIETFLNDFEINESGIRTQYGFIVHPEYLPLIGKKILKERFISRMKPIPDVKLQKFVIITSSNEFVFGNPPEQLDNKNPLFQFGEVSVRIDSNPFRKYIGEGGRQFSFIPKIIQSKTAGEGKSYLINSEIESLKKTDKDVHVFHHFIVDADQEFPIKSLNLDDSHKKSTEVYHLQFSDEIMKKGIKFWSYLLQLYIYGFVLPANDKPIYLGIEKKRIIFFEIPQLQKSMSSYPINNLSQFPLPIAPDNEKQFIDNTKIIKHAQSRIFNNDADYSKYYQIGINHVLSNLNGSVDNVTNLYSYMKLIYKKFFKKDQFAVSFRKLNYIEKYLYQYTTLYINSLPEEENVIKYKDFSTFFFALSVSAFYAYNCEQVGNKGEAKEGLTFMIVKNLFDDDSNCQKKIHFYTTKSKQEFFKPLKSFSLGHIKFMFDFNDSDLNSNKILRSIFSTKKTYQQNILDFANRNPNSFIARTKLTVPTLFRSSIVLNRIFLSQPIILSGDTGCGKTSSLMLIFEYFKIPLNDRKYSFKVEICQILNCHSGITIQNVIDHLKKSPVSSKKHVVFFDELNTSPASSYIEHLFLNSRRLYNCEFVFIGALNPRKEKNPISYYLTKVGLPQLIKNEEKEMNLIEEINTNQTNENMSEMMYHVHLPQHATEDIIFDFNPIRFDSKEDIYYPEEENYSVHSIIDSMAKYPEYSNKRKEVLSSFKKLIDLCVSFIRNLMNERAVISYRDIKRSMVIYNFLFEYYTKNIKEFNNLGINEIDIPIITSIISFVLRLPNHQEVSGKKLDEKRAGWSKSFQKVFDFYFKRKKDPKTYVYGNYDKQNKVFTADIRDRLISLLNPKQKVKETKRKFMAFVYQYTLEYLKDPKIWKFKSTFIHLFIMDICIRCKLPCFIIGKPGTSKSYAIELLDKYNKKMFISTYMSSRTSSPDGIKSQYYDAIYKEIEVRQKEHKGELDGKSEDYSYVVFIDEMGNANINPSRPLKFLHGILDNGLILNETGYTKIVPTIGVSNYTMDFANMNRGVLVYTDLPDINEILYVFEYDKKVNQRDENADNQNYKINNVKSFIDVVGKLDLSEISKTFQCIWPKTDKKAFDIPKTIALRSVYNIRFLIDNDTFDINDLCRILRELFNSKRLGNSMKAYTNLYSQCPQKVKDIFNTNSINNLFCFLERISCEVTKSIKSLSLFTRNYEIFEYFSIFSDKDFVTFLQKAYKNRVRFNPDYFSRFKHQLFSENFKDKPDKISQSALEVITKCIKAKNENIIFVGNHPCFDSCLDLLNVPYSMSEAQERDVILGSGFSSKFKLTNPHFYIIMIANISDLPDIDKQDDEITKSNNDNSFSFAFLDRTETLYLDWSMIAPFYIKYKFKDIKTNELNANVSDIQKKLEDHILYDSNGEDYLHTDIKILYKKYKKAKFGNEYLDKLINERWQNGIRAIILTKSKIFETPYLPKGSHNHEINSINIIDSNFDNFEKLEKFLEQKIKNFDQTYEHFIIFKCLTFNSLHFTHLKAFFDKYNDRKYHIFIIYYGCNPNDFHGLSSFKWPILGMEDITEHEEFDVQIPYSDINEIIVKLEKMKDDIYINKFENYIEEEEEEEEEHGVCEKLIFNLFNIVIEFTEKSINDKIENKKLNIRKNYDESLFKESVNLFDFIKNRIKSFDIDKTKSPIWSQKSQIISSVYKRLNTEIVPFILFAFGSDITCRQHNNSKLLDFFLKCKYMELSYITFLSNSSLSYDAYYFLFLDYYYFLVNNKPYLNSDMIKKKYIADKIICIISQPREVKEVFRMLFENDHNDVEYSFISNYMRIEIKDNSPVFSFQSFVDVLRFRSFAGVNFEDYNQQMGYYSNYFFSSIFNDKTFLSNNSTNMPITSKIMQKSILEFRNMSIFDIFKSPIVQDQSEKVIENLELMKQISVNMTCLVNFDDNKKEDKKYLIYRDFNKDTSSLKGENRIKFINDLIGDNSLKISMLGYYFVSKNNKNIISEIKVVLKSVTEKDYNVNQIRLNIAESDLSRPEFQSFGDVWNEQYMHFEWNFEDECNCDSFIDEIQSIVGQNSTVKPKFRKWLLSGYENKEPLAIIALRRYLSDYKNDKYKKDLAKILDPFFSDTNFVNVFINDITTQIKESQNDPFPFNIEKESVMKIIKFNVVFKLFNDFCHYLQENTPSIAQFIWFHTAFCNPNKYKLTTLLIKNTSFFTDFHAVPFIVNAILHLRHIFSYNPVLIPIILHCTSLFKSNKSKLYLFDLHCFDNEKRVFGKMKEELDVLEKVLGLNSKIINTSSYEQIKFIYQIYFPRYNQISRQINTIVNNDQNLTEYSVYTLLPNMLLTNFTVIDMIAPILYTEGMLGYQKIEDDLSIIFKTQLYKDFVSECEKTIEISLFEVKYEDSQRDFLGFSKSDYADLYKAICVNKRVLSFEIHNEMDDIERYIKHRDETDEEGEKDKIHLNTYNIDNFYIKTLFGNEKRSYSISQNLLKYASESFINDVINAHKGVLINNTENLDQPIFEEEEEEREEEFEEEEREEEFEEEFEEEEEREEEFEEEEEFD